MHVSVTDIEYKEGLESLQITTRVYVDDLQLALQAYTGHEELDLTDTRELSFINENLQNYLKDRFRVYDQKHVEYRVHYLKFKIEDDAMWCYLEIDDVPKLKSVTVLNRLLHEVYDDQNNMVHFRAFEEVKSTRHRKGHDTQSFEWD